MKKNLTQTEIEQYFIDKKISIGEFFYKNLANPKYVDKNLDLILEIFKDNQSPIFKNFLNEIEEEINFEINFLNIFESQKNFHTKENFKILEYYFEEEKVKYILEKNNNNFDLAEFLIKYQIMPSPKKDFLEYIEKSLNLQTLKDIYILSLEKEKEHQEQLTQQKTDQLFFSRFFSIIPAIVMYLIVPEVIILGVMMSVLFGAVTYMMTYECQTKKDKQEELKYEYSKTFSSNFLQYFKNIFSEEEIKILKRKNLSWKNLTIEFKNDYSLYEFQNNKIHSIFEQVSEVQETVEMVELEEAVYYTQDDEINDLLNKITGALNENKKYSKDLKSLKMFDDYFDKMSEVSLSVIQEQKQEVIQTLKNIYDCLINEIEFLKEKEKTDFKIQNHTFAYMVKN